ncbi:Holliday junction branch migration protein RuvA [Culicoidibacter larvae]|uniref:Holliday junction branch migration complex subunit RuvA n=1 Tax=Culicoidibacter larvae TaxID=2579976 RepID=A0A5R8Q880_9FIRM|nr:Holliday junction branch migration protein RuvA [Culicoidibacter larvae]TLG71788.1 Holliday junction branch migration protein RuvA [Culicoidibacter larvae]
MFAYILGIVTDTESDHIVVENQGVGYHVFSPYPYDYEMNSEYKVFTYQHVREDINALYGFKTKDEKALFIRLLSVKGIGPKVAIAILASTTLPQLVAAIEAQDINYLKKIPGIGNKAAQQIILDLKGKLAPSDGVDKANHELLNALEALSALGYSTKEVDMVAKQLGNESLTTEEYVKKAFQLLLK